MNTILAPETTEQDDAAERAAELFDVLMGVLTTDHERRCEAHLDRDVRRMQHRIMDADFGYAEPVEFSDCPGCEGEDSYVRDDRGKQSICLECGFRYTDREARSDAAFAALLSKQAVAA